MRQFFLKNGFLLFIFLFAGALRVFFLDSVPFRVDGDASKIAIQSMYAWNNRFPLFATDWGGIQNVYLYINGFFLKIFGAGLVGLRIFSALGGTAAIIATYFLAESLFNKKVALLSAFFLSVSSMHLVFSRSGLDVVHVSWLLPVVLYILHIGAQKKYLFAFFFAGVFLGFSQYFYYASRFIPLAAIFAYFVFTWKSLPVKKIGAGFMMFTVPAFLVYLPMILFYLDNPVLFTGRIQQVQNIPSNAYLFLLQVLSSFKAFFIPSSLFSWHFFSFRFLTVFNSVLFGFGICMSFLKMRDKIRSYFAVYFWIFVGTILAGALTLPPPQASRYLIFIPVVSIISALGVHIALSYVHKKIALLILILIITLYGFFNLSAYRKHEYVESFQHDIHTQIATYAGRYLQKTNTAYNIYFLGDTDMYYQAVPTLSYLTKKQGMDIVTPLDFQAISELKPGKKIFIILPSREKDLNMLSLALRGERKSFYNPLGVFLFWIFEEV